MFYYYILFDVKRESDERHLAGASILAAANPGCSLQLMSAVGPPAEVLHVAEFSTSDTAPAARKRRSVL
ncbi:MAG TPA: hypothetical protein VN709_11625 [Terriglobales bacterium]|nr:hypothetical protein [Terriglobales bacterium]